MQRPVCALHLTDALLLLRPFLVVCIRGVLRTLAHVWQVAEGGREGKEGFDGRPFCCCTPSCGYTFVWGQ